MLDAGRDLLLGSSCVGCARPGRMLCESCRDALQPRPGPAWPVPRPPGLVRPWAALPYDGTVRSMIIGHKERRLLALARPLGELLATAVAAAVTELLPGAPGASTVLLVPVPSRPASVRQRGHDPMASVVDAAVGCLRSRAFPVRTASLLRTRGGLADQSGLDAVGRARNLAGAFRTEPRELRRLARTAEPVHVVVCDDVLTTGATAAEGQRALRAVGIEPLAAIAVAATTRRTPRG